LVHAHLFVKVPRPVVTKEAARLQVKLPCITSSLTTQR